jgi:hypothetical protein
VVELVADAELADERPQPPGLPHYELLTT